MAREPILQHGAELERLSAPIHLLRLFVIGLAAQNRFAGIAIHVGCCQAFNHLDAALLAPISIKLCDIVMWTEAATSIDTACQGGPEDQTM